MVGFCGLYLIITLFRALVDQGSTSRQRRLASAAKVRLSLVKFVEIL
jgi:hypothetical protein